jgi:type III secretion protein D
MQRVTTAPEAPHTLELRVIEGPQNGARAPLANGVACVLAAEPEGQGDGADLVLREQLRPSARVRVRADLSLATLEVLQGEVQLGGELLGAGAQALWRMHAPLCIGSSVLAFGRACVEDWTLDGAQASLAGEPAGSAAADSTTTAAVPPRRRAEVWLATMGAGVLIVCGAALAMAHIVAGPRQAPANDVATLTAALRGSEFAALETGKAADGRPALRGRLASQAQRLRLDAWLAEQRLAPAVEIQVDESVARDVTEVFRVNGVAVAAQVTGPGRVSAQAAERDRDHLARAEEAVRRDVRGLDALSVRNTAAPLPPPAPPVVDDPGKRIASLVPGEPAYLVTADGARYFIGALLPTGHRITQIANASVTLERDGQKSTLNF